MKLDKAELKELKRSRSVDGMEALVDKLCEADEVCLCFNEPEPEAEPVHPPIEIPADPTLEPLEQEPGFEPPPEAA